MNTGNEQSLKGKSKVLGEGSASLKERVPNDCLTSDFPWGFPSTGLEKPLSVSPQEKRLLTIPLLVVLSSIFFMQGGDLKPTPCQELALETRTYLYPPKSGDFCPLKAQELMKRHMYKERGSMVLHLHYHWVAHDGKAVCSVLKRTEWRASKIVYRCSGKALKGEDSCNEF